MRILFANGRRPPPFYLGGDTVSLNILLEYLTRRNHECMILGCIDNDMVFYAHKIKTTLKKLDIPFREDKDYLSIRLHFTKARKFITLKRTITYNYPYDTILVNSDFLLTEFEMFIKQFKPDLVITQLEKSEEIMTISRKYCVPFVYFVYDVEKRAMKQLRVIKKKDNAAVIFISEFAHKKLSNHTRVPTYMVYQALQPFTIRKHDPWKNMYVTMINPVEHKGVKIVYEIVKKATDINFLLVEGWLPFNMIGYDFGRFSNVTLLPRQNNMHKVYSKTKILLMPSVWDECFGRVIIEAATYGIPSIASSKGGIPEAVGKGGILVDDYKNIDHWLHLIRSLMNDKKMYKEYSKIAKDQTDRFSVSKIGKKIEKIFYSLID